MKNLLLKPGFEIIFALSLIVILGLPPLLLAQNQDVDIRIEHGDTVVNGKSIKDLSAQDRVYALRDIKTLSRLKAAGLLDTSASAKNIISTPKVTAPANNSPNITAPAIINPKTTIPDSNLLKTAFLNNVKKTINLDSVKMDSIRRKNYLRESLAKQRDSVRRKDSLASQQLSQQVNQQVNLAMLNMMKQKEQETAIKNAEAAKVIKRNTQSFDYENVDNDGVITHIRFRVSDISNEDLKKMPHMEGGKFEIANLSIVPEFNTGSTVLMFSLPVKTDAEITLINSGGNIIFEDKAEGGYFNKTFGLVLNGVYFLQVKQADLVGVKRIIKEE